MWRKEKERAGDVFHKLVVGRAFIKKNMQNSDMDMSTI